MGKLIRTITLNPCFDLHYTIPEFYAGKENLVTGISVEAGGKGVNTSRALSVNGEDNLAYIVVGDENGDAFISRMEKYGVPCRYFKVSGRLRENITIHPDVGRETRISLNTFKVPKSTFEELEAAILAEDTANMLVSFSGRIPNGLEKDDVKSFIKKLIKSGAKVAVDSASLTPADLAELRPWFIKPNEQEIEAFIGETPKNVRDAADVAEKLVKEGVSETVMISLGGDGAAFSDGVNKYILKVPKLEAPVSTIGAGDSTIGGLLAGVAKGLGISDALRLAVSYGTAACMTEGTLPPRSKDVKAVFEKTVVEKI